MEIKLEHFVHDLVWLIKEDYNESLDRVLTSEAETERVFAEGENVAYFHILELIERQLMVFGAEEQFYSGIAPEIGKKASFKKLS